MTLGDCLLWPKSVALVGASDDPSKTTGRTLQYLRRSGFEGKVYPINPRRETVMGTKAWPSVESLPETPDHAFIMVPTADVAAAVADCVRRSVPLVTVLASGYSEKGSEGRSREEELRQLLRGGRTRLLGPNSIGVVNMRSGLRLTVNAAFAATDQSTTGGVFVASHSGSMIGALLSRGQARGLGFAGFVSSGSEIDLSLGELCAATLDDPGIQVYALFLESIQNGNALRRFLVDAAKRGKSVVAYKLGRSAQAAELSQSHTGAIAGEDAVADTMLKDSGVARVDTLDGLIEGPSFLQRLGTRIRERPKVAVVSTTGGAAAMIVDQLGLRNIEVAVPSEATLGQLAERGVMVGHGRIVDLTLAGTRPAVMSAALQTLLEAPENDVVVAIAGSSVVSQPELLLPPILAAAAAHSKPLLVFLAPDAPQALARLTAAGVPCFRTPEACADVLAAAYSRRKPKALVEAATSGDERMLNEAVGYSVLAASGISVAPYSVVTPDVTMSPLPYPVVVKVLSAQATHKTDIGGVVLGVQSDEEFRDAISRITASVRAAPTRISFSQILVQQMVSGLGEVLLSFRRDPNAGPLIMLAAGGLLAELHKDSALRLAPVDEQEARGMISEVRALAVLAGFRRRPLGDLDALASAITALSRCGPDIVEAEINPLIVGRSGEGVWAVDSVVRRRE
jgi:acetate---CoA ligase (ADP-forming)